MKDFCFIGVDVGLTGAVALVTETPKPAVLTSVIDMPVTEDGKQICLPTLIRLFSVFENSGVVTVMIEQQQAYPGEGVSSMFKHGHNFGLVKGVAAASGYPISYAAPNRWKKAMGCGPGKEGGRQRALELFPELKDQLKRKGDHDRADALLLAEYARKMYEAGALTYAD